MKKIRSTTKINKNGYTLIEVIIAALIFVILITVTMVTFGSNSNLQNRSEIIQNASQNAKYISEAIARDIIMADEVVTQDCENKTIDGVTQKRCTQIDLVYGDDKIIYQFSNDTSGNGNIMYKDSSLDEFVRINDQMIGITDFYLTDNNPEIGIHIEFDIGEGGKEIEKYNQTIDTTVTTRNYPNFYDKFTPSLP